MRHAKCAMFQHSRAQERRKRAWYQRISTVVGLRRWIGKVLESLVCAQTVTCVYRLVAGTQIVSSSLHCVCTDKQDQSFCWSFFYRYAVLFHATHDGANEIYVEDGIYVDEVKQHRYSQEAEAALTSHCEL